MRNLAPYAFDIANRIMEKHESNIYALVLGVCDVYDALHLSRLQVDKQGTGTGSAVMKLLTEYADEHSLTIVLEAVASKESMSQDKLFLFYQGFGFRHATYEESSKRGIEAGFMIREPV